MHLRLVSSQSAPAVPFPVRPRREHLVRACMTQLEVAYERQFKHPSLVDLRGVLRELPLLVQCATRVHDKREAGGAIVLGLDAPGPEGRMQRWPVLIARVQRLVLLFSRTGALDAAGRLIPSPSRPIAPGERWTRIDWASDVTRNNWY
ncbi:MAG: hypothetical protein ACO1OB_04250 [Archangium sp.]